MRMSTNQGPGVGPYVTPETFIGYNRLGSTIALGDVLMIDHLVTQAEGSKTIAANIDVGGDRSQPTKCWPWANLILPATTGIGVLTDDPGAWLAVVVDLLGNGGADDRKMKLALFGVVTAALAGSTNFGDDLYPANGVKTLSTTQVDGVRCVAKALCADGTTGTGLVLFNGYLAPGIPTYAS